MADTEQNLEVEGIEKLKPQPPHPIQIKKSCKYIMVTVIILSLLESKGIQNFLLNLMSLYIWIAKEVSVMCLKLYPETNSTDANLDSVSEEHQNRVKTPNSSMSIVAKHNTFS